MSDLNLPRAQAGAEPAEAAPAKTGQLTRYISWVALALMTTSSVASLRPAPIMARNGLASVSLLLVPALLFLLPTALVAAELASGWKGGVYKWVGEGISEPMGFLAVWCQFAMTIVYYPLLLGYVARVVAYLVNPGLAENGLYMAAVIITIYWVAVFVSSRGTRTVAGLSSMGLIIGTLIPGSLLVLLGMVFLAQGNLPVAPMTPDHLLPATTGLAGLALIVNNFLSYAGMEMNAVHVSSLRNPARDYPKAMFLAVGLVLVIFIVPALAVSWVVPVGHLSVTFGVMQAFHGFLEHFHVGFLTPVLGVMLVAAALGGMLTWLAGPSKGLLMISRKAGYLPPFLTRVNEHGVQQNMLVAQGVVTTLLALMYVLIPHADSVYLTLSVITTLVYLIMYMLMFVAAAKLRRDQPDHPRGYRAPILIPLCGLGLASSAAAFVIGFHPPDDWSGGPFGYIALVAVGTGAIGLLIPLLFYGLRRQSWKTAEPEEAVA